MMTFAVRTLALGVTLSLFACSGGGNGPDAVGIDTAPGTDTVTGTDPQVGPDTVTGDAPGQTDTPIGPDVGPGDSVVADLPGDASPPPPDGPPCNNGNVDTMDTSQQGLIAFAQSGAYLCWTAEPAVHPSAGPHASTGVRTFFNDKLTASLAAGNTTHPKGSIVIKELYDSSGIMGYATDLKISDGTGAGTWLFSELFLPSGNGYYGVANGTCTGCHQGGTDYVLTSLPR
jgi:hypothetical protein